MRASGAIDPVMSCPLDPREPPLVDRKGDAGDAQNPQGVS